MVFQKTEVQTTVTEFPFIAPQAAEQGGGRTGGGAGGQALILGH
jgi:hypothetical protein